MSIKQWTKTNNGASALVSTGDPLLDLFSTVGAMRGKDEKSILTSFYAAFNKDPLRALKTLFYARNIRGGLGERNTFRVILNSLANTYPPIVTANLDNIAFFGRWDDMFSLVGTQCETAMLDFVLDQLNHDIESCHDGKPMSLLAKWLPSINSHNHKVRSVARMFADHFGYTEADYRKTLAMLRKALRVVEVSMSKKDWDSIVYGNVPSNAMRIYRGCFRKHDSERFGEYMDSVTKGTEKIHSATLYPYDLVRPYFTKGISREYLPTVDDVLEAQWKALPNYADDKSDFLVVADTSGSMGSPNYQPICTSVGLAIYFAERNKGAYRGYFYTFSSNPVLTKVTGDTLAAKVQSVLAGKWGMSTNVTAVFMDILNIAVKGGFTQDQLPKAVVIISDMQFNACTDMHVKMVSYIDVMFKMKGYKMPKLVFWNVNATDTVFHGEFGDNVQFISGASASSFADLIRGAKLSATELMLQVLDSPTYACVVLP